MDSRNIERLRRTRVERKWLAIKYGVEIINCDRDQDVRNLFFHFRDILNDLTWLEERPIQILLSNHVEEVFDFLRYVLREDHSPIPLLLLVDDAERSNTVIQTKLADEFQERSYIFKISGSEAQQMIYSEDFTQFRSWCRQLVENVMIDNIISPESEMAATEELYDREAPYMTQQEESSHQRCDQGRELNIRNILNALNAYDPEEHELFVDCIAVDEFYSRMRLMFDNFADNSHLLELIRVSLTPSIEINPKIAAILEQIILQVLDFEFVPRMCHEIYEEISRSDVKLLWCAIENLMKVFLAIKRLARYSWRKKVQSQWDIFYEFVNHIPEWFWNEIPENLVNWLRNKVDEFTTFETKQRESEPGIIPILEKLPSLRIKPAHSSLHRSLPTAKESVGFWEACEAQDPPNDFRELSEIPNIEDIIAEDPPYVRRAIIGRKYENSQHYLDIMFRLLREDLISPLRDGIHLHTTNETEESSITVFNVLEVRGVQVKCNDGIEFRYVVVTNNKPELKTLLYGQIVCLSSDNFKRDFRIGCVVERKDDVLSTYHTIGVQFYEPFENDETKSFLLAEPSSYFEAYHHVLKAIKNINRFKSFPLERYLVHCKNEILKPLYMRLDDDTSHEVDDDIASYYECLRKKEKEKSFNQENSTKEDKIKYILESAHPVFPSRLKTANEELRDKISIYGTVYAVNKLQQDFATDRLNHNQRDALIKALTSELCLIQGPPGTGKTFIGVEILRTIIANRIRFGILQPMLLVCYTNAALDQFLEKVYVMLSRDIESGSFQHNGPLAVRLGTKSESDMVAKKRLSRNAVVNDYKNILAENENAKLGRIMREKRNQAKELSTISSILRLHKTKVLRFEVIKSVMSSAHCAEFTQFHTETRPRLLVDEAFGYWLLDKPIVNNRTLEVYEKTDSRDFEKTVASSEVDDADQEVSLAELFRRMNLVSNTDKKDENEESSMKNTELETSAVWDLATQVKVCDDDVSLFGRISNNGYSKVIFDLEIEAAVLDYEPQILKAAALSHHESVNIDSIFTITRTRRWELYNYWIETLIATLLANFPQEVQKYQGLCKESQLVQQAVDIAVLKHSLIIGATTTGAAKFSDLITRIGSRVVVIEESAEVLEGHCFASIPRTTEHLIMIGDHQQLRPNPSVYELARVYNLDVSMFERLIKNGFPHICLSMQHRMLPMLSSTIIRPFFYENLEDHSSVFDYPVVAGMEKPLYFWSHQSSENVLRTSYTNTHEINMIAKLARYLLLQKCYLPSDISVLTPYSEQQSLLAEALSVLSRSMGFGEQDIGVHTVDSFQGKENKVILLSLVRSNGEGIGFLSIQNRVCVALTRAKHGMFVVGNMNHLKLRSSLWRRILVSLIDNKLVNFFIPLKCQLHGNITEVYEPEDFENLASDGGCEQRCGTSLDCGHFCSKRCHVGNDHLDGGVCYQPCLRVCSNEKFKHKCQNLCNEVCGGCYQLEYVSLSCGHEVGGACQDLHKLKCKERCPKFLKCGHQCSQRCGELCSEECLELMPFKQDCNHVAEYLCSNPEVGKCTFPCEKILNCGHRCPNDCSDPCALECFSPVTELLPCGHQTEIPCSANPQTYPCPVEIDHLLESCGHHVKATCSSNSESLYCLTRCMKSLNCGHICIRQCGICKEEGNHSCGEICRKNLGCGHQCMDRCGSPCGPCKADCLTSCSHQACGSPTILTKTEISYGRRCSEICVLCHRACDNRCEHRICQLRCYQVCDVTPCESPCSKKLPCGHVCLGLCSEICPTVCGTCNQKKYMNVIEAAMGSDSKPRIHRLITIPFCDHIFPVSYLDEVVSSFKQQSVYPRCPHAGCKRAILGVQRYSRIIKEIMYKRYKLLEKKRLTENMAVKYYNFEKYKADLKQFFKPIDCLAPQAKASKTRITNLQKLREKWMGNHSADFLFDLSRSLKSLVYLYDLYFQSEAYMPKKSSVCGPNVERVCGFVSRSGNFRKDMETQLDTTCAWFDSNMSSGISGVFVPVARELTIRMAVNLTVFHLAATNFKRTTDIDESKVTKLSALLSRVNETSSIQQIEDLLKKVLAYIDESKLIPEKDNKEWKCFLNIPFPEF